MEETKIIRIRNQAYEAMILPAYGANCISLRYLPTDTELFRCPGSLAEMEQSPATFGLPILFPPNRIRDGKFAFQGREYRFPINEPERGNFIHGTLCRTLFQPESVMRDQCCFVYQTTKKAPYLDFPHAFTIRRLYRLTEKAMLHRITVQNDSPQAMPVGLGMHSAFHLISGEDYCLKAGVKCEWPLEDERKLSTGECRENTPLLSALRSGTLNPEGEALSVQLECEPGTPAELVCSRGKTVQVSDPAFRFLMVWNGGGKRGFVCLEPQTWVSDAPNLGVRAENGGFQYLEPGESKTYEFSYSFEEQKD